MLADLGHSAAVDTTTAPLRQYHDQAAIGTHRRSDAITRGSLNEVHRSALLVARRPPVGDLSFQHSCCSLVRRRLHRVLLARPLRHVSHLVPRRKSAISVQCARQRTPRSRTNAKSRSFTRQRISPTATGPRKFSKVHTRRLDAVSCVRPRCQGPLDACCSGPQVLVKVERPQRSEDVRP